MPEKCDGIAIFINPESGEAQYALKSILEEAKRVGEKAFIVEECIFGKRPLIEGEVFSISKRKPCWTVVVGGDGTLLKAIRYNEIRKSVISTVGAGRRCFYFDITTKEMKGLVNMLKEGRYVEQNLWMMKAEFDNKAEPFLNESVISGGGLKVMELLVRINGDELSRIAGDGIIVATASGSSAYSLSAGGPIVDPFLPSAIITPLNSMTLHARPVVTEPFSAIEVEILKGTGNERLVIDGQLELSAPKKMRFTLYESPLRLARVRWMRFYERVVGGRCGHSI